MKIHESITLERVQEAMASPERSTGFCIKCGEETDGVEPDAVGYDCEYCEKAGTLYGAEEVLLMLAK